MRPELKNTENNSPNPFLLPLDVLRDHIIKRLNVEGPAVLLIEGEPSAEQKKAVTATNAPALAWTEDQKASYLKAHNTLPDTAGAVPDLNTYHLIIDVDTNDPNKPSYAIGFCAKENNGKFVYRKEAVYRKAALDDKSPLLRYITENPSVLRAFKEGRSQDRYLLRYMEHEVAAKEGLIANRFINRTRFAGVNQLTNAWMNGFAPIGNHKNAFDQAIKQTMLDELVHYVDYPDEHDQDRTTRARKIIEADPSLLLSAHVAKNIRGCTPDRIITAATAFQLAVYNGDWPMWEMMVDVIEKYDFLKHLPKDHYDVLSEDERQKYNETQRQLYKADLFNQINDLEQNGLEVVTDNLLNKGVRILDADVLAQNHNEAERMKQDVIQRNAYQLIIKTTMQDNQRIVQSCQLACCDPNSKQDKGYREIDIPVNDPLFNIAHDLYDLLQNPNDGHGWNLQHVVTRDEHVLRLIDQQLFAQGIKTKYTDKMSQFDYRPLLDELKILDKKWSDWSNEQFLEHWHVRVSAELRKLPDFVRRLLSSMPYTWDKNKLSGYVSQAAPAPLSKNIYAERLYPCSRFLGDKFCFLVESHKLVVLACPLVEIVAENRDQKIRQLKNRLANQPVPNDQKSFSFCSLM